ncbi:M-phase inducer phosphatase isoform X2 [Neocloeon triangulifer]|uniref:M-phase inducer phosphatase isoform X2 n=1 Tax=Neocloeon triangulifer TaxID=2078957 RepID=UPI00286EC6D0|nr:M-phase inducer phosphatase isoform X2 [Neocloeon triangulifer]
MDLKDCGSPMEVETGNDTELQMNFSPDNTPNDSPSIFKNAAKINSPGSPSRSPHCSQRVASVISDKENSSFMPFQKGSPRPRLPLEDNSDSRDSVLDDPATFKFAQPSGLAPRKNTPRKELQGATPMSPGSPKSSGTGFFRCLSSGSDSIDDGFLEFLNNDKDDDTMSPSVPSGMGSLLSGPIFRGSPLLKQSSSSNGKSSAKRSLHRSLSISDFDTPTTSKARLSLFKCPSFNAIQDALPSSMETCTSNAFKRPVPPISEHPEESPSQPPTKRRRNFSPIKPLRSLSDNTGASPQLSAKGALTQSSLLNYGFQKTKSPGLGKFQRSFSDTDAIIKNSVERSSVEPLLIGDFSKPFVLPLMNGKHQDLKTISPDTMAHLLTGGFSEHIDSFSIIDCRYPYEFNGGHIKGAKNLFSKDLIDDVFIRGSQGQTPCLNSNKRHILIFHCEFSSERAPCLSRYLRSSDRAANKECYPQLYYPEVYLLHGGYKAFYEVHSHLCEPRSYVPMLSQGNEADLKHFRAKSRSWAGDVKNNTSRLLPSKFTLKRLDV